MTAQIGDIYKYQDKEYTIVALSSAMQFDPRNYGLEPHASSTGCWRGYWCEYAIENDALLLKNLYLFNADGKYPPFGGSEVSPPEFKEYKCHDGKTLTRPAHFGHRVYRDVNLPISYTGKILLGDGFIHKYYIHLGFQKSWAYKKLMELVFEEGLLRQSNDLSHMARAQRDAIKKGDVSMQQLGIAEIPQFVGDSFSPDYADKAWWLK